MQQIRTMKKNVNFSAFRGVFVSIFLLFCTVGVESALGQGAVMVLQNGSLPTSLNPGASGISGTYKADALMRQQWVGFSGAPRTTYLGVSGEFKFLKNFHGLGVQVMHDKIGVFTNLNLTADYSYHIELDKGVLGLGLRAGVLNVAFDASSLKTSVEGMEDDYHQENDAALQGSEDSSTKFDVGVGAFMQTADSYVGLSLLHLTAPQLETKTGTRIKRKPLLAAQLGRILNRTSSLVFEPRYTFITDFTSMQMDMLLNATYKGKFGGTVGYRLQDAIILGVFCNLSMGLYVGYDYEICANRLHVGNSGTHEVAVSYKFNVDVEKRDKRYRSVRLL